MGLGFEFLLVDMDWVFGIGFGLLMISLWIGCGPGLYHYIFSDFVIKLQGPIMYLSKIQGLNM